MDTYCYLISRTKIVVSCVLISWICTVLAISQTGFASQNPSTRASLLQTIRELVARNEVSTTLIKMNYTVQLNWDGDQPTELPMMVMTPSGHLRGGGRDYTHRDGTWAQDAAKQYCSIDSFYAQNELARSHVSVVDGEVMKWGRKPDLMQGAIDNINKFDWTDVAPTRLGWRPFEGQHLLSEILMPEYALVYNEIEMVDGRETYVVDVKRPTEPVYYGRIWIDKERGMPLRLEYYDKHPTSNQARLMIRVESIKLHQLPNGGWLPVEGTRFSYFPGAENRVLSSHISVDVDSITIEREDIPESLFTLTFPKRARVHNAIIGVTMGIGGDLDRIVEESLEAFLNRHVIHETTTHTQQIPTAEYPKETPTKHSQQIPVAPSAENAVQSTSQDTSISLDASPTNYRSFAIVWVFLSALLATFILTVIVWIIRNYHNTASEGNVK